MISECYYGVGQPATPMFYYEQKGTLSRSGET